MKPELFCLVLAFAMLFSVNAERGDNVIERLLDMKRKFQRRNELTSQLRQLLENRWMCSDCGWSTKVGGKNKTMVAISLPKKIKDILPKLPDHRKRSLIDLQ